MQYFHWTYINIDVERIKKNKLKNDAENFIIHDVCIAVIKTINKHLMNQ